MLSWPASRWAWRQVTLNVEFAPGGQLITLRANAKGEELLLDYGVDSLFNPSDRKDGVGSLRYTQTALWDPVPVHADGALSAGQAGASNTILVSSVDVAPGSPEK